MSMRKNKAFRTIIFLLSFAVVLTADGMVLAQETAKRIIKDIEVQNNKVVSTQSILSQLQTKKDREFSPAVLSEDIKRLYATGSFNDVSADLIDVEGGVKVVFRVKEKPILAAIEFKGNRKLRTKRLRSKMQIVTGQIFDQFKLKEDIEELKKFYAEKGFSLVNIKFTKTEKDNKVTVTLMIDEGARMRVRQINFRGNKAYSNNRLMKLLKTRKRWLFNAGFFKKDVLEEDTQRILGFYYLSGYIDAKVEPQVKYNPKRAAIYITFEIEEGKQYKVGNILLEGNTIFSNDKLEEDLNLKPQAIYGEDKLREDISRIQAHYFDEGYISSSVQADTALNAETGLVDISYNIKEGGVAYVDDINISGNTRTKDEVIRREMRLFPGDRYDGKKLKRSRERLYNLDYFEEVSFDTSPEPTTLPDKYDLNVLVKESKTGEFSFGAGYSSVDQFIGFIDLSQRNFDLFNFPTFTGGGENLRVRMEFGSERKDYELGFVEPWFLGYPLSVGFNIYSRTRDWDKYDERRNGATLFVGKDFGEYWRGKVTYCFEGVRITNLAGDASYDIKREEGKNYISSITTEITHDSRDNIYNPRTGWYNTLSYEIAGSIVGGDKDFIKYYTRQSKYFPVGENGVLELKLRGGLVEAYSDSEYVPIYERFYAGGANTIRGYKERRVGPEGEFGDPIGGRILGLFNAEYTYSLTKNLKWAFFYDTGKVWSDWNELEDGLKLKASVGTGIRVKTPLGPIRLDYGYALKRSEGDPQGRFHFSMSREF